MVFRDKLEFTKYSRNGRKQVRLPPRLRQTVKTQFAVR
jgi:hypothetical protein